MSKPVTTKILDIVDIIPVSKKHNSALLLKEGKYPVYSSEIFNGGVKGYTNNPSFNKNNETYIIFGDHTRSINIVSCPFSVMDNVKVLKIKKGLLIDELYLKYLWQNQIPNLGYSRHWKVAKNVEISIPTKDGKIFDIEKQREIALKYREIEKQKQILVDKIEYLNKSTIDIGNIQEGNFSIEKLNSMITHKNGKSEYTKEFCQAHHGNIPVFSGNNNSPLAYMDTADFSGEYLTYSKNGCAGYITIQKGDFSVNGDRCVIILNKNYSDLNLLYLKYYLEPIFRANIKGRIGINGKNEYTKINSTMIKKLDIEIPIPIKEDGSYDIEKQREIAQKFATIESIKSDLYNKVIELTNIKIN